MTEADETTASGLTSARIAACPDCYGRFLCQYHEGWSDAEDVLIPLIAQAQRDADVRLLERIAERPTTRSSGWQSAAEAIGNAPLITEEQRTGSADD